MPQNKLRASDSAALNGVSYRQLRSRSRNITLNNGEPLNLAIKKIIFQLLLVVLVIFAVLMVLFAKNFIFDKLTDNSYLYLSMDRRYSTAVSTADLSPVKTSDNDSFSVLDGLSKWSGVDFSVDNIAKKGAPAYSQVMEETLKTSLKGFKLTTISGLSNYNFLTEIYKSISGGSAVIVSMAIPRDITDKATYELSFGIVETIDFANGSITVITPYGRKDIMTTDGFISSTRFRHYDKSIGDNLAFTLGLINNNTAFIIKKNDLK